MSSSFDISDSFSVSNRRKDSLKQKSGNAFSSGIVGAFLSNHEQLRAYRSGMAAELNGHTLSVAAVVAVARYSASTKLNQSKEVKERVLKSRAAIDNKLREHLSVYGVSTGFGGSADTRTNAHTVLGLALIQHQQAGVISTRTLGPLPLGDPSASTIMPEAWVRAAMLIRANSLIRGHSAIRWELLENLTDFLQHNITPIVPLRGSISASGDLSPLSYVAGALSGNPAVHVYSGPSTAYRRVVPAPKALEEAGLHPISLAPKEHLGLLNGTAFSAAVASLVLADVMQLTVLAQVCTAMGTEALLGTRASYSPFIHEVARPHAGQIEVARVLTRMLDGSQLAGEANEVELTVEEDKGQLRQDRYPLRTAPQFIGPQVEDILHALQVVTQECNSTTDNPLVDGETGRVYHGGNFQAMAVTNAMEKTRLALHHLGKILFSQCTEMLNPAFNRGLPPSAAATDPSLNYYGKGIDIATASYVSELGYLANPVSTHIQSSEMHNQSVNSLALISARATVNAADVLTMLIASYLCALCQVMDLRTMQVELKAGIDDIVAKLVDCHFGGLVGHRRVDEMLPRLLLQIHTTFDKTATMDGAARLQAVAGSTTTPLLDALSSAPTPSQDPLAAIQRFRDELAEQGLTLLQRLQREYLDGSKGRTPASQYMGRTKRMYEFIRINLGIRMHGLENLKGFEGGLHSTEGSVGQSVTKVYEAIRDGEMQDVLADLVSSPKEKNGFMAKL